MSGILATARDRLLVGPSLLLLQGATTVSGGGSGGSGSGGSVPGALTALAAGTPTTTTVPLTWNAPSGATAITVQYRLHGASSWTTATASLSGTATGYTVTSLTAATAYDFKAFGTDATGSGTAGEVDNVSTASISGFMLPSAPLVVPFGQSNMILLSSVDANNAIDSSGTGPLFGSMGASLTSYLGITSAILFNGNNAHNGVGIYPNSTPGNAGPSGGWIVNPNTISGGYANLPSQLSNPSAWIPPSQWVFDVDGVAFQTWEASLSSQQKADVCGLFFLWHEDDSARTYAEKSVWKAAWQRFIYLVRTQFGVTNPALMPVFDCTPLPSVGNAGGHAMVYEAVCELAADPTNALYVALPQMADCDPRSENDNFNGSYHTNYVSYLDYSTRASFFIGQKLGSLAGESRLPAAMGTGAGPVITGASISGNIVTVTIQHDGGTALVLNGAAASGAGWSVLDQSYSPDLPGVVIPATAVAIVNATTLAITLAWVPVSAAGARLHYPWGNNRIGYGDAVTDNRASLTYSPGIGGAASTSGASLGTSMPIQRPITISAGVATLGFPLATPYVAPSAPYAFNPYELSGALPEAGTYTHGVGTILCLADDLSTSGYTAPASVQFGFTSNPGVPPTTWTQYQSHYNTTIWSASVPTPATAGTWYAWVQGLDSGGNIRVRAAGSAFTVN